MKTRFTYSNPVIRGFHPDPSICQANGKYYLVCSSFQYFPGIPLFESEDLINWHQIGHVLTRKEQLPLQKANSHGGIYAPTIRYYKGRFYVTATNVNGCRNFIVWTDDIRKEWSDPVSINQDGIDPSLYFEKNTVYFISNHNNGDGTASIMQCEIDPLTGKKLTESRPIWNGNGGRYLESPHMYRIGSWYYLMAAEGGTEYGHMVVLSRSRSPYGPFENAPENPIVSNRDLGGYILQGTGHGDLISDEYGNWWMVLLAFRQIGEYLPYHHLGRETCLLPVSFTPDGWLQTESQGCVPLELNIQRPYTGKSQKFPEEYTFSNTLPGREWVWLRNPDLAHYKFLTSADGVPFLRLNGAACTLSDVESSPVFLGIRQQEMNGIIQTVVHLPSNGEAGITLYMDFDHHYDFALQRNGANVSLIKRRVVGDINYIQQETPLPSGTANILLRIEASAEKYRFFGKIPGLNAESTEELLDLGSAMTRYLSSEVAGGFTGVMIGLYATATGNCWAEFTDFNYKPIQ